MKDGAGMLELQVVTEEKDLGVLFTQDLKPGRQCMAAAAKASRIIGLVRRNFRDLDKRDFLLIYKAYIRPYLEYCIQAWSPYLEKDMEVLERVQRSATRLLSGFARFGYEDRLRKLGITTLRKRRERGDLIEVYRIMSGKEKIEKTSSSNRRVATTA